MEPEVQLVEPVISRKIGLCASGVFQRLEAAAEPVLAKLNPPPSSSSFVCSAIGFPAPPRSTSYSANRLARLDKPLRPGRLLA